MAVYPKSAIAFATWSLMPPAAIAMRKVDGWQTLNQKLADKPIDLAA